MTVQPRCLLEAAQAAASETTLYTAPAATRVIIDKYTVTNTTAGAVTYAASVVPSGGTAGNSNRVIQTRSIQPGETYPCPEMIGQYMEAGDFVSAIAGAATSLTHRISGRTVT